MQPREIETEESDHWLFLFSGELYMKTRGPLIRNLVTGCSQSGCLLKALPSSKTESAQTLEDVIRQLLLIFEPHTVVSPPFVCYTFVR